MNGQACGAFDVQLLPQAPEAGVGDPSIGRFALDKRFHGDLAAISRGQMLAVQTATKGSAGYVAMERVNGLLAGRQGTFALQHSGSLDRGAASLLLGVVPDSGTGGLEGLSGQMRIIIVDGKHSYEFDYELKD